MAQNEILKQWANQLSKLNDQALKAVWNTLTNPMRPTTDNELLEVIAAEIMKRNIDLTNQQ